MPLWQWVVDALGALFLLVLLYGIALVVRRRVLSRDRGTFELSYRARPNKAGRGWVLGLGRYAGDRLEWFRIFSLAPRPKRTWERSSLSYTGRRDPVGHEQTVLYADHVVITCETHEGSIELALSPSSLVGFQSWLEARRPGTDWDSPSR